MTDNLDFFDSTFEWKRILLLKRNLDILNPTFYSRNDKQIIKEFIVTGGQLQTRSSYLAYDCPCLTPYDHTHGL